MRFRDLIAAVNQAGIWTVHLYGHVAARRPHRQFGDRDFIMQVHSTTKSPISRYAKSRRNLNRQINIDSTHVNRPRQLSDTWHNQRLTGVRQIQHFRHMKVTNQSDTWQDLTRVKTCVTSAKRHVAQPVQRTGGIGVSGIGI
jgi:hypothetical protein